MACEALHTGSQFLGTTLAHLDCQGRTIGAYGYGALADPGSPVALALTGVLTIFVALFGIRLLAGYRPGARDLGGDAIRIGLFLALATSWPAWRVVGYDLVMDGPAEIAQGIGLASALPGSSNDLIARLQDADNGIVTLTMYGSGRLTGGIAAGGDLGEAANGIALADQTALGSGRATFLATTIGAFGLLRVGAGILLALAPLMAGLLLFAGTIGIFTGWLRGLAFCALGSLAFHVIAGTELALLYPWLTDVLTQRQANTFTPSAPTELFVLALAFAVMTGGVLFLLARVTFLPALFVRQATPRRERQGDRPMAQLPANARATGGGEPPDRAAVIAGAVAASIRREEGSPPPRVWDERGRGSERASSAASASAVPHGPAPDERLGGSWRRGAARATATGRKRDKA